MERVFFKLLLSLSSTDGGESGDLRWTLEPGVLEPIVLENS